MKTIATKIKNLRLSLGLTQVEFGKAVGADQAQIHRWESGKQKPWPATMLKLAEMVGVTPQEFLGVDEGNAGGAGPPVDYYRTVPVTGTAGEAADDYPDSEWRYVPAPPFPELRDAPIFARVVVGDSMNLVHPSGSYVFVAPTTDGKIRNGDYVVVRHPLADGATETVLRQYVVDGDAAWLWPRSSDPMSQTPIKFKEGRRQTGNAQIIGIVVASTRLQVTR